MSEWKAEIVPPNEDGVAFPVAALKVVSRLGAEARVELVLSSPWYPREEWLEAETTIRLRDTAGSVLELAALFGGRQSVSAMRADLPSQDGPIKGERKHRLYQRLGESAGEFVRRAVGAGVAWRSEVADWMNVAFPEFACVAAPAFFPAEARLARILAAAGARTSRAAAWFGPVSGKNRLEIVDDSPDPANSLDAEWRTVESPTMRTAIMERLIDHDADPDELARVLCFETERTLGGKDGAPPVVPGLVKVGERFWFATEATTDIYFDPPGPGEPRGRTTLRLSDWSTFVAETQAPRSFAQVYLGEVIAPGSVEEAGLLRIVPPEVYWPAFPRWAAIGANGEEDGLWAFEAVPAPTRKDENGEDVCALHVPRREEDLVLFVVNDAGPPVVLGALSGVCGYEGEEVGVHIGRNALFHGELQVGQE